MPFVNDFFSSNRFKNLFGGSPSSPPMLEFGASQGPTPTGMQPSLPAPIPEQGATSRMGELYNPSTEATDRFNQLLSQYPERERPGMLRTIAAMLRDYTHGPEQGMAVYEQPFRQKLMDWGNQIGPAQQAANLERQENVNARTLASGTVNAELAQRRQEEIERKNVEDQKIKQQKNDISLWKAQNPNLEFDFRGPTVLVADPATGKIADSGVPTGLFSEAEKMALQQKNAMAQIGARVEGQKEVAKVRGEESRETAKVTAEEARITKATPAAPAAPKPETEANKKAREYRLARELYNTDPQLRKFIHLDETAPGSLMVDTPWDNVFGASWLPKGPTKDQHQKIMDYIKGEMKTTAPGLGGKTEETLPSLQQKARDFLVKNNLPVTDANIGHAIKTGRVK